MKAQLVNGVWMTVAILGLIGCSTKVTELDWVTYNRGSLAQHDLIVTVITVFSNTNSSRPSPVRSTAGDTKMTGRFLASKRQPHS